MEHNMQFINETRNHMGGPKKSLIRFTKPLELELPNPRGGYAKSALTMQLETLPVGKAMIIEGITKKAIKARCKKVREATGKSFAIREETGPLGAGQIGVWCTAWEASMSA